MTAYAGQLWGGRVERTQFDLRLSRMQFFINTIDNKVVSNYVLEINEIREIRFHNSIPLPWEFVELSEIYIESQSDGQIEVYIMFWTENCEMVVNCKTIDFTQVGQ